MFQLHIKEKRQVEKIKCVFFLIGAFTATTLINTFPTSSADAEMGKHTEKRTL